jgi:hypothetical protein
VQPQIQTADTGLRGHWLRRLREFDLFIKMSDESSFDFSLEEIIDDIKINAVFSQPAAASPPVAVRQIQADEVDEMDFDSDEPNEESDAEGETEHETPAKVKGKAKRPSTSFAHRPYLPILNKDTTLPHTYDMAFTLSKRVQKDARGGHRLHQSHYSTTLPDPFRSKAVS